MTNLPCPSCGGELTFQSETSIFSVCPYCTSSIVRHDMDLEVIGKMGKIQEDASPIQLGMTGRYKNKFFYTSGRIVYDWTDGRWNEWHLYFDTGESGWITDAQGEFAISGPVSMDILPKVNQFELGGNYQIGKDVFRLSDIKYVRCVGSEGELPFKADYDYYSTVYDFSNNDNKFLSLEISKDPNDPPLLHQGMYLDFFSLEPQGIKLIEGWI